MAIPKKITAMRNSPGDCPITRFAPFVLGLTLLFLAGTADASESALREHFDGGAYEEVAENARRLRAEDPFNERLWRLEADALMRLGRYTEAHTAIQEGLENRSDSLRLHLLGVEAARHARRADAAASHLANIRYLVISGSRFVRDNEALAAIGEAALRLGVEPRLALENFLRPGREANPPVRDAFLVIGRLALEKKDYGLASRAFQEGIEAFPDDPDMWAGLAASFMDGDRGRLMEYAGKALELNPHHGDAWILLANHSIDAENYEEARSQIERVLSVNPRHPEAHALLAVLAHLDNDLDGEVDHRADALASWSANPTVDHLIGRKLSQKYRFAEGADYQRRALRFDPEYGPARIQLAQDLLRLGREAEGWSLADQVHATDAYNVAAYNLVNLRDRIRNFTVLETPNFRLRMNAHEAAIYGQRAMDLLEAARNRLTHQYGISLSEQITVEIFPDPADFEVRTFGMPDNPGFLGVCFGPVVTINSPGSGRANWEAVLWHEFAHVITLTITRNRMPRWLSEGLSVYEEVQRDPSWGQRMSADYWNRIVSGRMQPISDMSAAFLKATSGADLQFAYFQSYLVIEFFAETYGFPAIRAALEDLRRGRLINDALAENIAPIEELDRGFVEFAVEQAWALSGRYSLARSDSNLAAAVAGTYTPSIPDLLEQVDAAIQEQRWRDARDLLAGPVNDGLYLPRDENLHARLARVCRELGDREGERLALESVAAKEGDSLSVVSRLLDIAIEDEDWDGAANWAEHWLAINPLGATPWRSLLTAHENAGRAAKAARAGETLLLLDPTDRASIHYRIARQLQKSDRPSAWRHVLLALEEAPRFRDAYALLHELSRAPSVEPIPPDS